MTADAAATTIAITELDPADEAAVEGAYQVQRQARGHDLPDFPPVCRRRFEVSLRVPWPGELAARWIARDGADVVGYLEVGLTTLDNLDNAFADAVVAPAHRRRGIGRALFERAVAYTQAQGRHRIMAFTPAAPAQGEAGATPGGRSDDRAGDRSGDRSGAAFAAALGMTGALEDVRRRLDVATIDHSTLDALLADARPKADGYSLVRWTTRAPDDCVDDVAVLDSRLAEDAPMGDLAWEPEKIDAARLRAGEEVREQYGSRPFSTAARHDATGRVVAWSELSQEYSNHDHAWQGITIVHPDHRGHRLGIIVKIENLRYALSGLPRLRYLDTWNAAVNDHMISINEVMGFRVMEPWQNWQRDL